MNQSKILIIQFTVNQTDVAKYAERSFIITCNIQVSVNHSIIQKSTRNMKVQGQSLGVVIQKKKIYTLVWHKIHTITIYYHFTQQSNETNMKNETKKNMRATSSVSAVFVRCQKVVVPRSSAIIVQSNVQCRALGLDHNHH